MLSIVNWLPFIDNSIVRLLKYIIFIYIFLFEISTFGIRYESNYLSPKGLVLILVLMLPGMALSIEANAVVDILIPFLVLWIFNYKKQFYYKVLYNASFVTALICVFSIISFNTGFFNVQANGPWNSTFGDAGFGGYRTGYSNSLFLFIPFLVFWHRVKRKSLVSYETLVIILLIYAQYISGGRAGVIASLAVVLIWLRTPLIFKGAFLILFLFLSQLENVQEQFRVADIDGYESDLNSITSGRVFLNNYYFDKFIERPIFGYGFGEKHEMVTNVEAHIVWLRNVIDGGIIYLLFLFYIFIEIFRKGMFNLTLTIEEKKLFASLFFATLIITFLEPNYLIGSVQGEIVYWILISILLKTHNRISEDQFYEDMSNEYVNS